MLMQNEKKIASRSLYISIVNYKSPDLTFKCIQSVCNALNNCLSLDCVVILCSDVSEDKENTLCSLNSSLKTYGFEVNSEGFLENKQSQVPVRFYQKSFQNFGFGFGNNKNFERIFTDAKEGDIVWILNNDTTIDSHAIRYIELAFDKDDSVIYGTTLIKEPSGRIQCLGGTNHLSWKSQGSLIKENELISSIDENYSYIGGYVNGASMLMSISTLRKLQGFDESYFMWCEEVDLCLKARQFNIPFESINRSHVYHIVGGSSESNNIKKILGRKSERNSLPRFVIRYYYNYRNRIYLVRKFFPNKTVPFIIHLLFDALKKTIGVVAYDDRKFLRLSLLIRSFYHGLSSKVGKTIDPQAYK